MLMYSAAREGWELKDKHPRTLETLVGEVKFERRYYRRLTLPGDMSTVICLMKCWG
ncbi:UPF0236 family transposase-like protein [Thermincola ferriacetica]